MLDSNLNEGKELQEVYDEIMKTISTDHLKFTCVSSSKFYHITFSSLNSAMNC